MKRKKGFTLIELVAVLVILAIIASIVTPLVLKIIKKSKVSADMRSVDAYGRSVEIAVASYLLDTNEFPTSFDDISVEYRGAKVECADIAVNMDGSIYLNKCAVNGTLVKDSKSTTGYYQFGKDTGSYMFYHFADVSENTQQAQNVGNSTGSSSTSVITPGTLVTYGGTSYYVLPQLTTGYTVLLKAEPLTYDEVVEYGNGISVTNVNGYGAIQYYTGDNCNNSDTSGCKTDYSTSNVKIVIDAWANDNSTNLKPNEQYSIMTISELMRSGYTLSDGAYVATSSVNSSFYNLGVSYWALDENGNLVYSGSHTFTNVPVYDLATVRPIIIVKTSTIRPNSSNNNGSNITNNGNNRTSDSANNPYTVDHIIIYVAILVIVVCGIILVIYLLNRNKDSKDKKEDKK